MSKVVTEAPRRGSGERSKKTALTVHRDRYEDDDHGPTRHKASRRGQYGWNAKEFSDVLGPLRRFLRKNVGRPWNSIYSELSQHLDKRSLTGLHIWDHIKYEVEQNCDIKDGKVVHLRRYWNEWRPVEGFYVHPVTGLLQEAPYKRYRYRPREDPDVKKLGRLLEHRRVLGIWYLVEYQLIERWLTKEDGTKKRLTDDIVVKSKRQLSKAQLKAAGLSNTCEVKAVKRRKIPR